MKKMNRIIIIVFIILLGIYKIIDDNSKDDEIYVVSENESDDILIQSDSSENDAEKINVKANTITVFVSGEVKSEDVITLEGDSRLLDAVENLGGLTEEADLNGINLAMVLEDGQHYIIPKKGENSEIVQGSTNSKSDKININTSNKEELKVLPGIGDATADKIIRYREENGRFNAIEEIRNVSGIGEKKFEDIRELISI